MADLKSAGHCARGGSSPLLATTCSVVNTTDFGSVIGKSYSSRATLYIMYARTLLYILAIYKIYILAIYKKIV